MKDGISIDRDSETIELKYKVSIRIFEGNGSTVISINFFISTAQIWRTLSPAAPYRLPVKNVIHRKVCLTGLMGSYKLTEWKC